MGFSFGGTATPILEEELAGTDAERQGCWLWWHDTPILEEELTGTDAERQ